MICLKGGIDCVSNLRHLNPSETPKKSTLIIKLGTKIYNSDVTNKGKLMPKKQMIYCEEDADLDMKKVANSNKLTT